MNITSAPESVVIATCPVCATTIECAPSDAPMWRNFIDFEAAAYDCCREPFILS